MKLYLSSSGFGKHPEQLTKLFGKQCSIGYIPNALDHLKNRSDKLHWINKHNLQDLAGLQKIGLNPVILDLSEFFGSKEALQKELNQLHGVWVSGGNVFTLRQAMHLSGFDQILMQKQDFVYAGYSAGCCVLSPTLKPYQWASNCEIKTYSQLNHVIWKGLGLIDFVFMPHYKSNHPESALIDKEIAYCHSNNITCKTFSDGEVYIIDHSV